MVNIINTCRRINNFISQNFKFLGNQNLLDTHRTKLVFNYTQQDNNIMLIYKYCGNQRLNSVANLLEFISEDRSQK